MLALSVVTVESKVLVVRGITVEWGVPIGAAVVSDASRRAVDNRSVEKAVMVTRFVDLSSLSLVLRYNLLLQSIDIYGTCSLLCTICTILLHT